MPPVLGRGVTMAKDMAESPADDPWAPLPTEALSLHPGEATAPREVVAAAPPVAAADAAAPAVAAPAPTPASRPAPTPASSPAPTPEQERALAELAAKVAKQRQPTSLVGQVLQREHRQQSKQARAKKLREAAGADVAPQVVATASLQPADAPACHGMAGGEPPPDHDPRLAEPWFLSLPAAEQERLRKAWRHQHERQLLDQPHHVRERHRRSVAALLTFAVVAVLGGASALLAMCAGGLTAIWWRYTRPGRFGDPVTAVTCFYVVHAIAALVNGGVSPSLVFDSILVVAIAALVGFSGEMRSSGGFVD